MSGLADVQPLMVDSTNDERRIGWVGDNPRINGDCTTIFVCFTHRGFVVSIGEFLQLCNISRSNLIYIDWLYIGQSPSYLQNIISPGNGRSELHGVSHSKV